jgi:hypothetical protein
MILVNWLNVRKYGFLFLGVILMAFAGRSFYNSRHLKEPVVIGPGVTQVKKLSDYFSGVKGTINDSNVYVLEGAQPGGTILILGGSHPEEPASRLTTWILTENAVVEQGRIFVISSANRSATTVTLPGEDRHSGWAIDGQILSTSGRILKSTSTTPAARNWPMWISGI